MNPPAKKPIRLLLVDDHEVVRVGLRILLERFSQIEVVGEAVSVAEALSQTALLAPDVVLLDIRLPDGEGFEFCREIAKLPIQPHVLVLTSHADEQMVLNSIAAGAEGYLLKEIDSSRLVQAIESVAAGQAVLDPSITKMLLGWIKNISIPEPKDKLEKLSPQEKRILALVSEGKTNKEIASDLALSDKTVKNYFSNLMEKLQLQRRAQAAAFYIQQTHK